MNTKKFNKGDKLTYKQAYEYVRQNGLTKLGVDNNPLDQGGYHEVWFVIDGNDCLSSYKNETGLNPDKDGVDYEWSNCWWGDYTGSFYLLDDELEQVCTFQDVKVGDVKQGAILISPAGHKCEISEVIVHYKNLDVGGYYMGAMDCMGNWQFYLHPKPQKESRLNTEQIDNQNI